MKNATETKPTETTQDQPAENQPAQDMVRYPHGCPIEGHENYGCACTPPRPRRR